MFFSIIIPFYNIKKEIFYETLFSVFNQHNCNFDFEIIVVDNGSEIPLRIDNLDSGLKNKIKLIRIEENLTIGPARNIGIKHSKGEWIFFLDGDDILEKNFFEIIEKTIRENSRCEQIKFRHREFFNNFRKISINFCEEAKPKYTDPKDFSTLKNCAVWTSVYKKDFLIRNNLFFLEEKHIFEDLYFYFITTIFSDTNKSLILIDNILINYRKSEFQTSYNFAKELSKFEVMKTNKRAKLVLSDKAIKNIYLAILFLEKNIILEKILSSQVFAYIISTLLIPRVVYYYYYLNVEVFKKTKFYCKKLSKKNLPFINKIALKFFKFRFLTFICVRIFYYLTLIKIKFKKNKN